MHLYCIAFYKERLLGTMWLKNKKGTQSYQLEIIAKMLKRITAGDFWREQCVSMHVWHQACGRVPTHSTSTRQKQRPSRSAEDSIYPGHKVTHFPEQEKIQLSVITAVQHYSLEGEWEEHAHRWWGVPPATPPKYKEINSYRNTSMWIDHRNWCVCIPK